MARRAAPGGGLVIIALLFFILMFAVFFGTAAYQGVDNETAQTLNTTSEINPQFNLTYRGESGIIRGGLGFMQGTGFLLLLVLLMLVMLAYFLGI